MHGMPLTRNAFVSRIPDEPVLTMKVFTYYCACSLPFVPDPFPDVDAEALGRWCYRNSLLVVLDHRVVVVHP